MSGLLATFGITVNLVRREERQSRQLVTSLLVKSRAGNPAHYRRKLKY